MQPIFSSLLIASLLAHATFGCCLHHAHADEKHLDSDPHQHVAVVNSGQVHLHHTVHRSEQVTLDSPFSGEVEPFHRPHPCEDGNCSFARTECASPTVDLSLVGFLTLALPPETSPQTELAQFRDFIFSRSSVVSLTLRRHLVLAVLVL